MASEEITSIVEKPETAPAYVLEREKASLRRSSQVELAIGLLIVIGHFAVFAYLRLYTGDFPDASGERLSWKLLFRSIFFILGLVSAGAGLWGLYRSRHLTLDDVIPTAEAIAFLREGENVTPNYTYVLLGGLALVMLAQLAAGLNESIPIAGFAKQDFLTKGEYWRILTGATLHAGFLHIYFNGQALYGIGQLIEQVSNRAHLSIIFLLSIIGGGFCSLILMPTGTSVGASGGIMGLIGYLAVFGQRRQQQLPPGFSKSIWISIVLTGAVGIVGYQFIDNFAHLGGLLAGAAYGLIQVPSDLSSNVRATTGFTTKLLGGAALAVFVATCLFSIALLLRAA